MFLRERGREDWIAHYVFLDENAPAEVAARFMDRAHESCDEIAAQPLRGAPIEMRHPELARLRK